jgi:hypothetical protein
MDYITRLYQSKASQLQEQVNLLEAQLQQLAEDGNTSIFSGTGKGQQTFNDEQLKDQMRQHKRSGFFGAEVADDKQSQEYKDARDELARRSAPKSAPAAPVVAVKAKAPTQKKSGSVADKGADAGGYGPPSSMYEPPVQDTPIAPPANASPRVQATDADGKPSNTSEARGNLQKAAMNPSGAYTPTPKTNERRDREKAERQGYWRDGADHGSARPPEPTKAQKEFEVSTQQPTTGVGPDGETLPQAEKRVRETAQKENNWKAGQFVNNLLYNRKFKGEQDARTPAQDPEMANGVYSTRNYGNGTPDAQRGQHSMDPETWMGKGTDEDPMRYVPKQVSTQDDRPTSGRKPNYPSSTMNLLKLYGVK